MTKFSAYCTKVVINAAAVALVVASTGCASIAFENGQTVPEQAPMAELVFGDHDAPEPSGAEVKNIWHNEIIFQIAEFSAPVTTNELCPNGNWNRITTKVSPLNLLVGLIDNAIIVPPVIDIWTPWEVEYSCK